MDNAHVAPGGVHEDVLCHNSHLHYRIAHQGARLAVGTGELSDAEARQGLPSMGPYPDQHDVLHWNAAYHGDPVLCQRVPRLQIERFLHLYYVIARPAGHSALRFLLPLEGAPEAE